MSASTLQAGTTVTGRCGLATGRRRPMYAPATKSLTEAAGWSGCAGIRSIAVKLFALSAEGWGMKLVERYGRVRHAVRIEGISRREAARRFGIDPRTVAKMLAFSLPPGCRRSHPPARPKLDAFVGMIDRTLEDDKGRPAKQRHTSKRIFERLRDEHGCGGGVPLSILHDSTKLALARIVGDGSRQLRGVERAIAGGLPPSPRRSAARSTNGPACSPPNGLPARCSTG